MALRKGFVRMPKKQKDTRNSKNRYNDYTTESSPRLLARVDAARYCGVSTATFSRWVAKGIVPAAVPYTNRWDRRAIDCALDLLSGIQNHKANAFDQWLEGRNARSAKGDS